MRLERWVAVALFSVIATTAARAQATRDVMMAHFSDIMIDVADAGRLARLDSTPLSPSVRREIRIYTGFGLGLPNRIVRIWQDERATHGRVGVFWPTGLPRKPQTPEADRVRMEEVRASATRLRAFIDSTYHCRASTQSRATNVCWIDEQPDRVDWTDVLAKLDSNGIDSIHMPQNPKIGFDGWSILVELRSQAGYRAYTFWAPDTTSTDSGERAVARMASTVADAFSRRIGRP